ncbi:ORF6N domain-containing protein [Caproiciproducens galactitolivorans]|uniref:ORF6N domain-containing protein n=1 Tax=Caproiciproducens galactitolivorans TaxID=642589 RepID=UPI00240A29BD|nr:ORF6N domain-containing protein [Caproiciproducens galactitolivorans]
MSSLVKIGGAEVAVKEYRGQRVVTFKDIDQCHGRPDGTARRNFSDNRHHLVEGTDYFIVKPSDFRKYEKRTSGIESSSINNRGTAFITESGYLMLVKSFTDDLAWDVQRQLVNTYFRKGQADESLKLQIQQERAHAMLMNAKNRALKTIMQTIGDKKLSAIAAQVFGLTAIEEVTGQKIDYRPECGKLYSAGELAKEVGSNRITVGKRATAAGLKTDEYGMTVLSKSEHGPKQVPTFMYNEKGRKKVFELFGKEAK